jgi:hypothetical protein
MTCFLEVVSSVCFGKLRLVIPTATKNCEQNLKEVVLFEQSRILFYWTKAADRERDSQREEKKEKEKKKIFQPRGI